MTAGVSAFYIKADDTAPSLRAVLEDEDGVVDLTGATVAFVMRGRADSDGNVPALVKVDAAGVVVDAANGVVRYDWAAEDTDTPGTFDFEFKVTIDGVTASYPSRGYNTVVVGRSLR